MANELTKNVMAAIVQRLGPSTGYEPIKRNPKVSDEGRSGRQSKASTGLGLSSAEENTLKKLIHKDVHLSDQMDREVKAGLDQSKRREEPSLSQLGKGGVVRLDDLLQALKK